MARNSPLKYCLKDGKLIGVALATTDAMNDAPTKLELEIVRVFKEWHELQAENRELKAALQSIKNYQQRRLDQGIGYDYHDDNVAKTALRNS